MQNPHYQQLKNAKIKSDGVMMKNYDELFIYKHACSKYCSHTYTHVREIM